jgi:hypothetical protein
VRANALTFKLFQDSVAIEEEEEEEEGFACGDRFMVEGRKEEAGGKKQSGWEWKFLNRWLEKKMRATESLADQAFSSWVQRM